MNRIEVYPSDIELYQLEQIQFALGEDTGESPDLGEVLLLCLNVYYMETFMAANDGEDER